jgi:hypothetical protein
LLYVSIVTVVQKCRRLADVFNKNLWLILAFLSSAIPVLVLTVEARYGGAIMGLFYAVSLCGDVLWDGFDSFGKTVRGLFVEKQWSSLAQKSFPWTAVIWLAFVVVCFAYLAVLNGQLEEGVSPLFTW